MSGSGWITLASEAPKHGSRVLIVSRGWVHMASYLGSSFYQPYTPYSVVFVDVTHWRPLPEPPR